jgi:hypothetical protein
MVWAFPVHPVLNKFGDVPDDLSHVVNSIGGDMQRSEMNGADVIDMIRRQGWHLYTLMSGCDPIRDSLPTLTVAHPQFSQGGGCSACTWVTPTNPISKIYLCRQ